MESQAHLYISNQSIVTNLNAENKESVIRVLANLLYEQKLVKQTFLDKVLEREKNFPTGLRTKSVGVAIPHTDPDNVNRDSIAVAVLNKPVTFLDMADAASSVEVKIVFLLALTDSSKHLHVIQKIIEVIKDDDALNTLLTLTQQELFTYFSRLFSQ